MFSDFQYHVLKKLAAISAVQKSTAPTRTDNATLSIHRAKTADEFATMNSDLEDDTFRMQLVIFNIIIYLSMYKYMAATFFS